MLIALNLLKSGSKRVQSWDDKELIKPTRPASPDWTEFEPNTRRPKVFKRPKSGLVHGVRFPTGSDLPVAGLET